MADPQTPNVPARQESRATRYPTAWGRGPSSTIQQFANEVDRIFENFGFGRFSRGASPWASGSAWAPDIDVYQTGDQVVIKADLPGLTKDDVTVDVTDQMVTITGERKSERREEQEGFYRSERSYGSFSRTIPLPEGAIAEQAKATFRDGVLEITMPAPPVARSRRLEITGEPKK